MQQTTFNVFGSFNGFPLTKFFVERLKGTETSGWISSQPGVNETMMTNDLSMAHLVDIGANIIGEWPLIVYYLKETGCKEDGVSLVVRSFSFSGISAILYSCILFV